VVKTQHRRKGRSERGEARSENYLGCKKGEGIRNDEKEVCGKISLSKKKGGRE